LFAQFLTSRSIRQEIILVKREEGLRFEGSCNNLFSRAHEEGCHRRGWTCFITGITTRWVSPRPLLPVDGFASPPCRKSHSTRQPVPSTFLITSSSQNAEVRLRGIFVDETPDRHDSLVARIHPSSIDHLPVMRGITKAVATAAWCSLSGPNGKLTLSCCNVAREKFDADFFTSFSPISVSQIRELWVGQKAYWGSKDWTWRQTATGVHGVFGVLTKVEDLTIVNCQTGPFL